MWQIGKSASQEMWQISITALIIIHITTRIFDYHYHQGHISVTEKEKLLNISKTSFHFMYSRQLLRLPKWTRLLSTDSKALSPEAVKASVNKLSQGTPFPWTEVEDRNAITKTFEFADFSQAWSFMSRTALLAEKMDHHPEWFNVYSTLTVTLTTHDCDGVSDKDIKMAKAMEDYAKDLLPKNR